MFYFPPSDTTTYYRYTTAMFIYDVYNNEYSISGNSVVGSTTLAKIPRLNEEVTTIEDVYEPYLLQEGYIKRSSRGRIATEKAYEKLGIKYLKGLFS